MIAPRPRSGRAAVLGDLFPQPSLFDRARAVLSRVGLAEAGSTGALRGRPRLAQSQDYVIPANTRAKVAGEVVIPRTVYVYSLDTNLANLRVGGPAVDATSGQVLGPGQTLLLPTSAEVFVFAPTSDATVAIMERLEGG